MSPRSWGSRSVSFNRRVYRLPAIRSQVIISPATFQLALPCSDLAAAILLCLGRVDAAQTQFRAFFFAQCQRESELH